MIEYKEELAEIIVEKVCQACTAMTAKNSNLSKNIKEVLGESEGDLISDIRKTVNASPILISVPEFGLVEQVSDFIAVEYILFKSQESREDPDYMICLENFIDDIVASLLEHFSE